MSSVEPARHSLYSRLEEVLGAEHADTLMTYLPRHEADDVATRADIARLEARFDRLESRLEQMQRSLVVATVGSLTALTAIFSLVVTFFA
jgi:ubiquinone biosynthesis protein UbiJ